MKTLLRNAYRGMLWLHPYDFREEFGAEMLWIFDEEYSRGSVLPLFFDIVRSTAVQNVRSRPQPQLEAAGPFYVEIDSTIPAERIANLWLISISSTLSLFMFMSMMVPGLAMPLGKLIYTRIQILASAPEQVQTKDLSSTHRARHAGTENQTTHR